MLRGDETMSLYKTVYQDDPEHPSLEDLADVALHYPEELSPGEIQALAEAYLDLLGRWACLSNRDNR